MYIYSAFGLQIASDFDFDNLLPGDESSIDVYIEKGKVSNNFLTTDPPLEHESTSKLEFFFRVPDVGRFYISNGSRIIVEPLGDLDSSEFKLYVLGTAFCALLFQRGSLPIHGSALIINKKCIIITGNSGVGKSTLATAFRKQGCYFLTDDLVPLIIDQSQRIWVQSGYPQQKLWKDSAEMILDDKTDNLVRIEGVRDKYFLPVINNFCIHPSELSAIFELVPSDIDCVMPSMLNRHLGLHTLIANTHRIEMVNYMGLTNKHFAQCATIACSKPVFRINRPRSSFTVNQQINVIMQIVEGL